MVTISSDLEGHHFLGDSHQTTTWQPITNYPSFTRRTTLKKLYKHIKVEEALLSSNKDQPNSNPHQTLTQISPNIMSNNRNDYPSGYGYGSIGYGYGSNDYGNGSTNGNTNGSYTAADAMNYMASRAPANQPSYGPNRFSGPTYSDTYGLGSAAAQGFGNGSRPNRTTWEYGPSTQTPPAQTPCAAPPT